MIVCKLMGGLGNQMFQYAYAFNLAREFGEELCLDSDFYGDKVPSIFSLDITERTTSGQIRPDDFASAKKAEQLYHVIQFGIRKLNHERIGQGLFHYFSKRGYYFNFDPFYYPSVPSKKKNKYVYGYFQGVRYFEPSKDELMSQFMARLGETAGCYEKEIKACNAVAVHIRLGDYLEKKNRYLDVCTDAYYSRGIEYIKKAVNNPVFYVFTNDMELAMKKEYIPSDARFVTGTRDYEDMLLMKACKHFVISASTFSWWGSYLSDYKDKITVAPGIWMKTLREEPDIAKRDDIVRINVG